MTSLANIIKAAHEFCLGLFLIALQLEKQAPVSIEAGHPFRSGATAVELGNLPLVP